jgi:hypothetical protein
MCASIASVPPLRREDAGQLSSRRYPGVVCRQYHPAARAIRCGGVAIDKALSLQNPRRTRRTQIQKTFVIFVIFVDSRKVQR